MINKFVITGPSSSGKTSIIKVFDSWGYTTVNEVAEDVLRIFRDRPNTPEYIKMRQDVMCDAQFSRELSAEYEYRSEKSKIVIFDRGMYDYIGFSKYYFGEEFSYPLKSTERYKIVFSLTSNNFTNNDIRVEKDLEEAKKIYQIVKGLYVVTHHKIIEVPNMSEEPKDNDIARAYFIEKEIKKYMSRTAG